MLFSYWDLWDVYTSFDGNPCLARQVELFAHAIHRSAGHLYTSAIEFQLNLDVLLHDFGFSVEKDDRITFSQLDFIGQEGINNTSWVSDHTTVFDISTSNCLKRKNLY